MTVGAPSVSLPRTAIIGGGVIGLSVGWRLAQRGCAVTVLEREASAGRGASWAAAGMLAAGIEAEPTEEPLFTLGRISQTLWPAFAAELEAAAGMSIGYEAVGTLAVASTRDQAARLRHGVDFQSALGGRFDWLTGAEARRLEPALSGQIVAAALSPDDHRVDNRLLGVALAAAFQQAGGTLRTGVEAGFADGPLPVLTLRHSDGTVTTERFDRVVLAGGAWSRTIPGLPPSLRLPVRPVKGQMLALRMPVRTPLIRHTVWGGDCYLVPRSDGRLLVGATTEEQGFDGSMTAGGVLGLLDDAFRTLPGIEELPIQEMWTGFRPGSPDDMPILGESGKAGIVFATGHHRNGILLTPVTGDLIAELIATGRPPAATMPFRHERFAAAVAA